MKKKNKISIFDIFNILLNLLVVLIMAYPLYIIIISSVSNVDAVAKGEVFLFPVGFTLDGYINVFKEKDIWIGYRNSIIYVVAGVFYDLGITITCAYVMSKDYLPGKKLFTWFFLITMFISGGMIPDYLLRRDLDLINNRLVLILGSMSCYNMIVARSFYSNSISDSLYEAASIDGASEIKRFWTVALPLSKPIIAVIALYTAVSRWNSYMPALLYIYKREAYPLQVILREILVTNSKALETVMQDSSATEEMIEWAQYLQNLAMSMKYSIVFIACAPLLIAYPFVQKHFVKGVMVGSVKG